MNQLYQIRQSVIQSEIRSYQQRAAKSYHESRCESPAWSLESSDREKGFFSANSQRMPINNPGISEKDTLSFCRWSEFLRVALGLL